MIGEDLTEQAVTALLRARMGSEIRCTKLQRGPRGNAQETWFVGTVDGRDRERELVLRRSSAAGTLDHTDRSAEAALMQALHGAGLPVPEVLWLQSDPAELGRPYLMMERLPGTPPVGRGGTEALSIAAQLGEWLARLHALPANLAPAAAGAPPDCAEATRRELAAWERRYRSASAISVPALGALLAWLSVNVPDRGQLQARLLWGDPGAHNMLAEDGRVTALLDWELGHLGDPLEDLGAALWVAPATGLDPGLVVEAYESVAGPTDREALRYYEVMACVDRSVMMLAGVDAYLEGEVRPSAAGLGQQLMLASLRRGAALAGWPTAAPAPAPTPRALPARRLRPDAGESIAGVAGFLREQVLPALTDPRLRRELKTAAFLLDDAAARSACEEPEIGDIEDRAVAAERAGGDDRDRLRAELVADLAVQQGQIPNLERLYGRGPSGDA